MLKTHVDGTFQTEAQLYDSIVRQQTSTIGLSAEVLTVLQMRFTVQAVDDFRDPVHLPVEPKKNSRELYAHLQQAGTMDWVAHTKNETVYHRHDEQKRAHWYVHL